MSEPNNKLWVAAGEGDEALVSQLIEQGAKVDWRRFHRLPGKNGTALHNAAENDHPRVVTRLLDSGWSLEARNKFGHTPLLVATDEGNLDTVRTLLLRRANIDTQDNDKETPLYAASCQGLSDLVKILLQCGADQTIRNKAGKTAEDAAEDEETRAVFREFNKNLLKNKDELLKQAITEEKLDLAFNNVKPKDRYFVLD